MANSKVIFYGETLIDLTQDTVEADALLAGYTAHDKNGETITGTLALNFFVVGGEAQPASPGENTIWVNTSADITGWVFSVTEPTNPTDGMVWFVTGTASPVGFNAVRRNGLWVYPTNCQQYVSGVWVRKTAKTYQNGAWVSWRPYLYNQGNECADVTGGWAGVAADFGVASGLAPTITKGASAITAEITTMYRSGQLITGKSISFSGYKTLTFVVTGITAGGEDNPNYYPWAAVFKQRGGNYQNTTLAHKTVTAEGTVNVDISNVSSGYVGVGLYYNNTVGKTSITISDIYLE